MWFVGLIVGLAVGAGIADFEGAFYGAVLGALAGYLILHDQLSLQQIVGIACVICAGTGAVASTREH